MIDISKLYEKVRNIIVNKIKDCEMTDNELHDKIGKVINNEVSNSNSYLSMKDKIYLSNKIYNSIRGFGILDNILEDENITEIMINGPNNIFVEKKGKIYKLNETFETKQKLDDIIQRIVGKAGREVNQAHPIVDTRLKDGSRVNIVLPPVAIDGATVTIRKFSKEPMTINKLIEYNSITKEIAYFLKMLVESKYNIFISGGTGSGKTTFLNALSNFIPRDERVITIEDSAELQIINIDNIVRLETRNSNSSGVGEISIRDLIKSALRMRPERIVVGEVRGGEALDMLQAMNTGHDGSLSTGHANSTKDMLSRLETMVLTGEEGLPLKAIRQQIASAIDIIIHLSRLRDKSRKTVEISEVVGIENDNIVLNKLYEFVEKNDEENMVNDYSEKTNNKIKIDGCSDANNEIKTSYILESNKSKFKVYEGLESIRDISKVNGCLKKTQNNLINVNKLKVAGLYEHYLTMINNNNSL